MYQNRATDILSDKVTAVECKDGASMHTPTRQRLEYQTTLRRREKKTGKYTRSFCPDQTVPFNTIQIEVKSAA